MSYGELEHHGVKGQKWGVRNGKPNLAQRSYLRKQKDAVTLYRRAAKPNSSKTDRLFAALNMNLSDMKKGIRAGAKEKIKKTNEHIARIERGEASLRDVMQMYGKTTAIDLQVQHWLENSITKK
jgi:DNA-binding transcriptional regulator WhiA